MEFLLWAPVPSLAVIRSERAACVRRVLRTGQMEREREPQDVARFFAFERQLETYHEDMFELGQDNNNATSDAETSVTTNTSANTTPLGSGIPTGSVVVTGRDRTPCSITNKGSPATTAARVLPSLSSQNTSCTITRPRHS
ncbi:hypothetical protein BD410DRAFT_624347 [Rickenella mellea]|uniref:Uncharacterized protein n=1 Tax=Rickenella mellea TaxID=50990 RepID=A0A4Y7PLY3_9AGAM|nr:hypothetical protein BD410DRAFT_624347 [Rickenella mellea]